MMSAVPATPPQVVAAFQFQLFTHAADGPIHWRLLSRNNREAGRGLHGHPTAQDCTDAIAQIQAAVAELTGRIRRVEPNRWLWEVSRGEELIAVAGHRFDRHIRCEQAMTQFLNQLPTATMRAGLLISGARRWTAR